MIRRFYIHNFRCFENFELPISGRPSVLLIGRNGAGKTTIARALEILQRIARGTNRVGQLLTPKDFTRGRTEAPIRFELEVEIQKSIYAYRLALEYPAGFRELRVLEETFAVDGRPVYTREYAQVRLARTGQETEANFRIDWHLVALPIIQQFPSDDPLNVFRKWLADAIILRPIPELIKGDSTDDTLQPDVHLRSFGAWFSGLLAHAPSAYSQIDHNLRAVLPDLLDIKNPSVGQDARSLVVQFSNQHGTISVPFDDLSDGEKCFMISAVTIAANNVYGPLLCFWDEPDNFLAPAEIGSSIIALRRAFESHGQLLVTSHHPEAISRFSDENTLVLYRNSHLEPVIVRSLVDVRANGELKGDLVDAIIRGDVPA